MSERQQGRSKESRDQEAARQRKAATDIVKRTRLLFNYRQCMLGKSTEYH